MALEIERKFLVCSDQWRSTNPVGVKYRQGYLPTEQSTSTVRIRIAGDEAFLTIKGPQVGITRHEFEYSIPVEDAESLLKDHCRKPCIQKTRYTLEFGGLEWVVDEFAQDNAGLVVAEIELGSEDQPFDRPPWIGEDVSHDRRYTNSSLARHPIAAWK